MTIRQLRPPGLGGAPGATADPATTQESAGTERTLRLRRDAPLSEPSGAADAVQIATPRGTVLLPGLAFAAGKSFGLPAWRCEGPDDFGPTLKRALDADLPSLVVLPIDYSIDVAISQELGQETVAT